MNKLFQQAINSKEYLHGVKDFKEGNIKNVGVPFNWYKKSVMAQEWQSGHYAEKGYTILRINKQDNGMKEVESAFISTDSKNGHLECDYNELLTIQAHREGSRHYPMPLEKV